MHYTIPNTIEQLREFLKNKYLYTDAKEIRGKKEFERYETYKLQNSEMINNSLKKEIIEGKVKHVSITVNNFPYSKLLSKLQAKHFVIWQLDTTTDFSQDTVSQIVEDWILDNKFINHDYIIFKNNMSLKSIKQIDHFQLFIIPKKTKIKT